MPLWPASSIEENPAIQIAHWRVYEVPHGDKTTRHLSGYNVTEMEGRVSSAIQSYDPETRIAITRSGRSYELLGSSGPDPDAAYVWHQWTKLNGITEDEINDVSTEYEGSPSEGSV